MKANIRIDMRKQYFPSLAAPNQSEHKVALDDMWFYYHKDKHFNLFQGSLCPISPRSFYGFLIFEIHVKTSIK